MFHKPTHLHVGATTLIAKTTEIQGDLHFSGNLEIEGTLVGNIIAKDGESASLRVLQDGKVIGKIQAPLIIINGKVEGEVVCSRHLELAAKADVQGNVHYHFLEVVKGAQVNGKLIHTEGSDKSNQ